MKIMMMMMMMMMMRGQQEREEKEEVTTQSLPMGLSSTNYNLSKVVPIMLLRQI